MSAATVTQGTIPETITVPSVVMIEAIAALRALAEFDETRSAGEEGPQMTGVGDWARGFAEGIELEAFGLRPNDADDETWPVEVAYTAREYELCADLIERHLEFEAENHPLAWRARLLMKHGGDIRAAGTTMVMFPTSPAADVKLVPGGE